MNRKCNKLCQHELDFLESPSPLSVYGIDLTSLSISEVFSSFIFTVCRDLNSVSFYLFNINENTY